MDIKAEITKEEDWARTVKITVPAADVDTAFETVTKRHRKKAKIPGFRPGKVPLKMVAERFADAIRQDVIEALIPAALQQALSRLKLSPIGTPSLTGIGLVEPGNEVAFDAEIEVRPDYEITGYKDLKLQKQVYEVTDGNVDRAIDNVRDEAATTTEVSRPAAEGDVVVCNLKKLHDSLNRMKKDQFDNITIELRAERTRPELLQGIVGMSIGEGKDIDVEYPAEEPDPDLAGNKVRYRVWMKSVSQKTLPVADDAFAKSVTDGKAETLAQLRDAVRSDLARRAEHAAMSELRMQVRRAVVEANPVSVPETFLQRYLDDITTRLKTENPSVTPETVRARFEPMATEQFRWDLALFEIARIENLAISSEEINAVLSTWPESAPEKPDRAQIENTLVENKVYDSILQAAEIEEVPYAPKPKIHVP